MKSITSLWPQIEGESLYLYHRLVGKTIRWKFHGKGNLSLAKSSGRPILWAFWHEQLSPFIMYGDRYVGGENFCIVRVGDPRGDILERLASRMGGSSFGVDMQGNPMAAGRAVLRVIQAMKAGKDSFIAPDGPDGPAFEPKKGVAFLARKAEAVVIPVGVVARPLLRLQRWDKYQIPIPFSTIHFHYGEPITAKKSDDEPELLNRISTALSNIRFTAQDHLGIPRWPKLKDKANNP